MRRNSIGPEIYDTITNYNDRNNTPLSKAKIREAIDQVILEDKVEANNVMVDMFSPQRNQSDDMIYKVENLTMNDVGNNLIDKVANLKINDVGKYSNRVNVIDV